MRGSRLKGKLKETVQGVSALARVIHDEANHPGRPQHIWLRETHCGVVVMLQMKPLMVRRNLLSQMYLSLHLPLSHQKTVPVKQKETIGSFMIQMVR